MLDVVTDPLERGSWKGRRERVRVTLTGIGNIFLLFFISSPYHNAEIQCYSIIIQWR